MFCCFVLSFRAGLHTFIIMFYAIERRPLLYFAGANIRALFS
ncbi:hypothetical protein HMPREF9120_02050 [Neisseria sp. oral taxon 020 str. F0370]|nr:hypothetical protein HMPREF9120_02050 [Neisseria sp. oral taxon 020 str. F0370]